MNLKINTPVYFITQKCKKLAICLLKLIVLNKLKFPLYNASSSCKLHKNSPPPPYCLTEFAQRSTCALDGPSPHMHALLPVQYP